MKASESDRLASAPSSPSPAPIPSDPPVLSVPVADFSRQYRQIREEVLAAIERVCAHQRYILGDEVVALETALAAHCHASHAVGCASGTDAIWLAMTAAGIGPGDRVITSPFSFFASVSAILRAGATPVLCDIDPATFNLDPTEVEQTLQSSPLVKAILPVHLYGQCADWDRFRELKQHFRLTLIEDAAQAFGAAWKNTPAGSLGDLACFSFYPTKNLSAYGDAGCVTTNDPELAERSRMLRAHGMRKRYYHDELGWNSRIDTIQAAVLLVKLNYIDQWNQQRIALAANYDRLFQSAGLAQESVAKNSTTQPSRGIVLPYVDPRGTHVFHQYVIRSSRRDDLRTFLSERKIGSEIYYPLPLHLQKSLASLGYSAGDFPESERAAREVLALPIYPELTTQEQSIVVNAIADFLS